MTAEAKFWRLAAFGMFGLLCLLALVMFWPGGTKQTGENADANLSKIPAISISRTPFSALPGWQDDTHQAALDVFVISCMAMIKRDPTAAMNSREALGVENMPSLSGQVKDWISVCEQAFMVANGDARQFFETHFVPIQILQADEAAHAISPEGLFTGYFEPAYPASRQQTEVFSVPVLARPDDLVMVDLGVFREELAGQRIAGRVAAGRLQPYEDHAAIIEAGLATDILAWMDPNDLLFLQIQGSGKLKLDDKTLRVGYAAQNGHPYTAIGRPLIERGEVAREDMSMQAIYDWLESATPQDAANLRHLNASYVFFRILDNLKNPDLGPLGAQGLQLTPMRSLAVDRRYHAMGTPIYIVLAGDETTIPLQQLMIAQDTGGAIRGPVRGDVYVGSGTDAGRIAGAFNRRGMLYVLLPTALAQRLVP